MDFSPKNFIVHFFQYRGNEKPACESCMRFTLYLHDEIAYSSLSHCFSITDLWYLVQDWLNLQTDQIEQVSSNLTLGREWLMQMGEAASRHGLRLQYCMALSRNILQSLEIPAVTQVCFWNLCLIYADIYWLNLLSHICV